MEGESGFSLAFSAAAKKQSRKLDIHGIDRGDKKEFVISVGADGLQTACNVPLNTTDAPKTIPKQENTYRVGPATFKPSYIPESADDIGAEGIHKFETSRVDTAISQDHVTYGLIKRERDGSEIGQSSLGVGAPLQSGRDRDADVLKNELKDLPPEASLDAYEAMPVESFGEALFRGMGWTEGRAIGRGSKDEIAAKEIVRRPHRLGLGAAPAPAPATHKKYIKPGETREAQDTVYLDPSGTVKSAKSVDSKRVDRIMLGALPGKVLRIAAGRHAGLKCKVQALEPKEEGRSERARVRLLPSHEVVVVGCDNLVELSSDRLGREGSHCKEKDYKGGKRMRREMSHLRRKSERQAEEDEEKLVQPWLVPNIRVKIVDKRALGGRLYLKKGTIVDVKTPTVCDVFVEDIKESILDLKQEQLETVVPGTDGTPVLVLLGRNKGRMGRLLQRNTQTGLAAIQIGTDPEIHTLSLDDISEYCGPLEMWDE